MQVYFSFLYISVQASFSTLYMPEPENVVAHGDASLAVDDFLARTDGQLKRAAAMDQQWILRSSIWGCRGSSAEVASSIEITTRGMKWN